MFWVCHTTEKCVINHPDKFEWLKKPPSNSNKLSKSLKNKQESLLSNAGGVSAVCAETTPTRWNHTHSLKPHPLAETTPTHWNHAHSLKPHSLAETTPTRWNHAHSRESGRLSLNTAIAEWMLLMLPLVAWIYTAIYVWACKFVI